MKFTIYKKSRKFYWSSEKIIYATIFSSLALGYISEKVFETKQNDVRKIFLGIALFGFVAGLVTKFIGFTQIEKLEGILEGQLILKNNSI